MKRILVLHGPNLNMLGTREPEVYGTTTLDEIDRRLHGIASDAGVYLETFQSNSEAELVTQIQEAQGTFNWLIINPAAYTHTSLAIRDAILAAGVPAVEVHLSNVHRREAFRHHSTIADVVVARVMGYGDRSYDVALHAALQEWGSP